MHCIRGNGIGTYRNPVIPMDYSDLDVIRVKEEGISHFHYFISCNGKDFVYAGRA